MTTVELIDRYYKVTEEKLREDFSRSTEVERVLAHLLMEHKKLISEGDPIETDPSGYWFHKMFRQTDVINMHADMSIWLLLQNAPIFWELVHENEIKNE